MFRFPQVSFSELKNEMWLLFQSQNVLLEWRVCFCRGPVSVKIGREWRRLNRCCKCRPCKSSANILGSQKVNSNNYFKINCTSCNAKNEMFWCVSYRWECFDNWNMEIKWRNLFLPSQYNYSNVDQTTGLAGCYLCSFILFWIHSVFLCD